MKEYVRVAVLGMGNMGRAHTDRLRTLENVEVAAICSRSVNAIHAYNKANSTSIPAYDNYDTMLDMERFDALYICLPPFMHNGQLEKAARLGIHVFIEKPIAIDVNRGHSMANAVLQGGVKSQVGYHMRFGGAIARLRELLASGKVGRPTLFSASYECNSLHTPWWIDISKSGGQILEQIIHLYDMSMCFLGDPTCVVGFMENLCHREEPGYSVEDTSAVSIQFSSGALAAITGSNCAIPGKWNGRFRIVFENLVADFEDHNHGTLVFTKENNREEVLAFTTDALLKEDEYFIDVIRGEKPEIATIHEGLKGLALVAAATASAQKGGEVVRL